MLHSDFIAGYVRRIYSSLVSGGIDISREESALKERVRILAHMTMEKNIGSREQIGKTKVSSNPKRLVKPAAKLIDLYRSSKH